MRGRNFSRAARGAFCAAARDAAPASQEAEKRRKAAEREAGLLEQVLATGLKSPNPDRRQEALDSLESLAALASHVRHLMLVQELRHVVSSLPPSQETA